MRRFYAPVENITATGILLDADETRHLRDVLRLRTGDEVAVFDGVGREYLCTVGVIEKRSSQLMRVSELAPASPESHLDLTVAASVLKGDKTDLVVQKAVELGVSTFVPLWTARCDVAPNQIDKRVDRWRRIAMEATKQSGRARLMRIAAPVSFASLLDNLGSGNVFLFSERRGEPLDATGRAGKITAIMGPEGGWDDSELEAALSAGLSIITLGGRILRAETAAIAIAAILQHRFGDVN